ncbi:ribonuclease HI [Trypanosoma cruzi]|nr:ribonuclease HI [Trypanosoma cruzi]
MTVCNHMQGFCLCWIRWTLSLSMAGSSALDSVVRLHGRVPQLVLTFSIIFDELRDESSIPTPADLGMSTPPSVASIHERWPCGARASSLTLRFSLISSFSSVIEWSTGSSTPMVTR